MKAQIDRTYTLFLDMVSKARKMTPEEVHPIAAGRVWTGRQAFERKLVDELGGLDAAIHKARALAGLAYTAPAREARPPKQMIPPAALAGTAGFIGYILEGVSLLNQAAGAGGDGVPTGRPDLESINKLG